MAAKKNHTDWLKRTWEKVKTADGKTVAIYELKVDTADAVTLKAWAKHFREHYCLDSQIDDLRDGTKKTRAQYLNDLVFPDKLPGLGPATRSGDFAEILIADLLEYQLGYWTPRTRYADKLTRNESPKGTDVMGFKFNHPSGHAKPSKKDELITFESKAQLSGKTYQGKLQEAVEHSAKDVYRMAESLNAMKRRLLNTGNAIGVERVQRFQDGMETPYIRVSGAAAILCSSVYDAKEIASKTDCSNHENLGNLMLVVVHAEALMGFVHALYERAAHEA